MAIARLESVDIDCPDDLELRSFYQELTGMEAEPLGEHFPSLVDGNGFAVRFQQVEHYQAPTWPTQERGQQMHLDFIVDDIDDAVRQVIALGATGPSPQPGDGTWRVMLGPAGHPFCLTTG